MSIKKIAELSGVSPATVSRVLNHPEYKCQPLLFAVPHDIQPDLDVILIVLIHDAPPCCLYFTRDAYSIRRYTLRKYADYVVFWRK